MSFIIRNISPGSPQPDVVVNDIGLTIPGAPNGGPDFDMRTEQPNDVATSADLIAAIDAGFLIVLDPIDGVTPLTVDESKFIVEVHNDPHFRLNGAELSQLDDVDVTGAGDGDVLQYTGGSPGPWNAVPIETFAGGINLEDLGNVTPPPGSPLYGSETFVLVGDGMGGVIVSPITGGSPGSSALCEPVEDIVGEMIANRSTHTDITVTYTDGAGNCDGTLDFAVDDVFLRNTGDTLDSGTLTIAPGATLLISGASGSPLASGTFTILQDANATIETPTGNFNAPNAIVNKEYVDSIAGGLDWKESVRAATTPGGGDVGGTYAAAGSPPGTNDTITGAVGVIDGVALQVGDRVLIKDQTDATQNGIYVVTAVGAGSPPSSSDLLRAEDQNGNPGAEVSAGNATFAEQGLVNQNSGWVLTGDGILVLNTDELNWTQFAGAGSFTAEQGLAQVGTAIALDVDDLTSATISLVDSIAFHDVDGAAQTNTGTQTYNTTVQDFVDDLGIPYNITSTGIVVNGAGSPTGYGTIEIVASAATDELGIAVTNGDGTTGDPTIGLDIKGLSPITGSPGVDTNDRIAVYDVSTDTNVYYTVGEVATSLTAVNSFATWAAAGNTTGDGSIAAASGSDTATLSGGTGINLDFTASSDTVEFSLDFNAIPASGSPGLIDENTQVIIDTGSGPVTVTLSELFSESIGDSIEGGNGISVTTVGSPEKINIALDICGVTAGNTADLDATDTIAVCDGTNTVSFSLQDILDELDVPSGITGTGLVVKTVGSPDTYATRNIVESTTAGEEGAQVNNGDGVAGDIEVGVDINNLTDSADDMAATDEFIVYDGANNVSMTGQQVADGVVNTLGISIENIGGSGSPGQLQIFIEDPTRGSPSKKLSVQETALTFSDNIVQNNGWVEIGNAVDALSGFIVPMNATIVRVTAHTSSKGAAAKPLDLYVNGSVNTAGVVTFPAGAGESEFTDITLDVDVDAGDKIRLRGGATGGSIQDTVVTFWIRWRAV